MGTDRHNSADNMEIAPGVSVGEWKSLDLRNNPNCEVDWQRAISIVECRLVQRYFEPCNVLIATELRVARKPTDFRYGFAIMAINCLLVETLQSFIMGKTSTRDQSEELSKMFLTTAEAFKNHFNDVTAKTYYEDVRCGILHIGETHNMSLIRVVGPLVSEHDGGIIINRTRFHEGLRKEFDRYLSDLRSATPSQRRTEFRKRLKKKMNFICRIKAE